MCCPKRFDTRPWAFACAYTTLLMYSILFLMFIPFVFHKGIFDEYAQMADSTNPVSYLAKMGTTMYIVTCFLCFSSLLVAFLSLLCIIGIHKERSGFLIPYLIVKSIITLIVVVGSFFVLNAVRVMDDTESLNSEYFVGSQGELAHEMLAISKAILVLMVLVAYWLFITPIVVVSTHCHRIIRGTTNEYAGASLIAMEAPPAQEIPAYQYAVKLA